MWLPHGERDAAYGLQEEEAGAHFACEGTEQRVHIVGAVDLVAQAAALGEELYVC